MGEEAGKGDGQLMICSNTECGAECPQAKDSLCKLCRLKAATDARRKYAWTPAMDAELARAFQLKRQREHSAALTQIAQRYRLPRYIVHNRAQALGRKLREQRPWTAEEIAFLEDNAGSMALRRISQHLHRSQASVSHKLIRMGTSSMITEGYSLNSLAELFGVRWEKVNTWVSRGLLAICDGRVPHESIAHFVWEHMEEYRFASCEEWWLKTMLKPTLGRKPVQQELRRTA